MKSKIYLSEAVKNTERKFGAVTEYQPVIIVYPDGSEDRAMYTIATLKRGIKTAANNPEDWPEDFSFWDKLFLG